MKKLGTIVAILFLLMACSNKTDAVKFKEEYESYNGKTNTEGVAHKELTIDEDNPMVYATQQEIEQMLIDGTGIIYLGFPDCPWCRNVLPTFIEACKQELVTKVLYFNNKDQRDTKELDENNQVVTSKEGTSDYYKLLDLLGDQASVYSGLNDESIKRIYYPTIIFVNDGKIVAIQISTIDSVEDPRQELTSEQHQQLLEIYINDIQKTKEACNDAC